MLNSFLTETENDSQLLEGICCQDAIVVMADTWY
jgi:hypothetical protein